MPRVTPKPKSDRKPTKAKKPKLSAKALAEQKERRKLLLKRGAVVGAIAVAVGGASVGYSALSAYVRDSVAIPATPPMIGLTDRPAWMSDRIAGQIVEPLRLLAEDAPASPLDDRLLQSIHSRLAGDAWVMAVHSVRREAPARPGEPGMIWIDCTWREPVAIVRTADSRDIGEYRLVADAQPEGGTGAILLPMQYRYDDLANIVQRPGDGAPRVIEGVKAVPPQPGGQWNGSDLRAGLDMAVLLHGRPEAADVATIDVEGVASLRHANTQNGPPSPIVLRTRYGTDLYWGRSPRSKDFLVEATVDEKLAGLRKTREQFGPSGNYPNWVDLRLGNPRIPAR